MRESSQPWRPFTANCCSVEEQTFCGNFSRCRTSKSDLSKNTNAPVSSFRRLSFSDLSRSSSTRINEDLAQSFGPDLFDFQLSELRAITQNFSSNFLLGEGGFGTVHKGYVDGNLRQGLKAQAVAVKLLDIEGLQGHREWLAEKKNDFLSTNFMPRGSLENHLFKRISVPLPWGTRLKIAAGAAKGLAFLHGAEKPVIYRDFKTSNVLLDSDFTVKLSDFGLAKMGPEGSDTHVTTRVMGTYGYAAPEYVSTGRRATEKSRPKSEQNIVEWTKPYLTSSRRLRCIIDPRLAGQYPDKGTKQMALLARQCVSSNPKDRPKMPSVVETLEALQHCKEMAVACGQSQAPAKSTARNGVPPGGRLESRGAGYRKSAPVTSSKKT
ncbi:SERINE/THREONINE-PROTEIN KINASE ACTIVE SITE PROTEIN-RELATED [Salix purpurea]|uniref:SERINE/THREONINE-PROTEIN KINASE ACTIVE SITE PROTEIN-RELATED n=1 Tax=Salix purpurea TaxID=77065 RepID=A0A9Q0TIA9_SALPP|nr:SERINE/THREONINE-PROTEIN KINASE ACTIVE SITE PROTEIN-RELATED [Salix purpurea]